MVPGGGEDHFGYAAASAYHAFPWGGEAIVHFDWEAIIGTWGAVAVFGFVMLESAGLPVPGETTLVGAAILAGNTGRPAIAAVLAAAAGGAIVGDNIGFWVGRVAGVPLLARYGGRVGLGPERLRLGQYVFRQHGGKIVFFGRFVAVLRAFAALLAGANRYPWPRFLLWNAAGGILWATIFGLGGYLFGRAIHRITGPVGIIGAIVGVAAIVVGWLYLRRHEAVWQARADAAAAQDMKRGINQNPA